MLYDATVRPLPMPAVLDLRGPAAELLPRLQALGLAAPLPGRSSRAAGGLELLHPGPEHWLLLAPLAQEEALLTALQVPVPPVGAAEPESLVLAVSDAYAFFAVLGPQARELLAVASPLDTDAGVFPADGATFTEAFGLKVLLIRRALGFEVAVERSYAPLLADWWRRTNHPQEAAAAAARAAVH